MSSKTDDLLDAVDAWKGKVHDQLKRLNKAERNAYWARIGRKASELGLKAVEPAKSAVRAMRWDWRNG